MSQIQSRQGKAQSSAHLLQQPESSLSVLYNKTRILKEIEKTLNESMPEAFQGFYRVANYHNGTLILFTPSAIYVTRMRYHQKRILSILKQHIDGLSKISVKVRPPEPILTPNKPEPRQLSQPIKNKLAQIAAETSHDELKKILLKMAQKTD